MRDAGRSIVATMVAVMLMATAGISTWLIATAGGSPASTAGVIEAIVGPDNINSSGDPIRVSSGFQASQPRDPFKPLTPTSTATTAPPTTAGTSSPGTTGTGVTTTSSGVTTTSNGDTPITRRITLQEIRDVAGVLRATVIVDNQTFQVGEGETFGGGLFKVVSLTETAGVFMFGDNVFTLSVGQSILK